jgi:hypothetical protein
MLLLMLVSSIGMLVLSLYLDHCSVKERDSYNKRRYTLLSDVVGSMGLVCLVILLVQML